MLTPTAKKAEAKGITKESGRQIVFERGVYELSKRIGCSEFAAKTYAIEYLQIPDPPMWTSTDLRTNNDIRQEVVRTMFDAYVELFAQYKEVCAELEEIRKAERNREESKKNEYVKMLSDVKSIRNEVKQGTFKDALKLNPFANTLCSENN
jgi:hypothetical protein